MNTSTIEIRTFSSPEEISEHPKFVPDSPINEKNYKKIIGDYHFGEDVLCCFERHQGSLCRQKHKRGWVAERDDGIVTIIGNHCAHIRFGADSRLIADQTLYNNTKRRNERLGKVIQQNEQKEQRLARLGHLQAQLKVLEKKISSTLNEFGDQIARRLRDKARTGNSNVSVTAVKYRDYIDEEGRPKRERSAFRHTLGSLKALDLVQSSSYQSIYRAITEIEGAHYEADELTARSKTSTIEDVARRLNLYEGSLKAGQQLLDLETVFFSNNYFLFCFMINDRGIRYKTGLLAMHQAGILGGKDKAKEWLFEKEKMLKKELGVDAIEID